MLRQTTSHEALISSTIMVVTQYTTSTSNENNIYLITNYKTLSKCLTEKSVSQFYFIFFIYKYISF